MHLISLLHLPLKSDEVIDLLEFHDLNVVYDFDRLHEGSPDAYWASSHEAGFELRFDERQLLNTIFMYARPRGDFLAIDPGGTGISFHRDFATAKAAFQADGIPFSQAKTGEGWIKGNFGRHAVHYEFNKEGSLSLVTIMAVAA